MLFSILNFSDEDYFNKVIKFDNIMDRPLEFNELIKIIDEIISLEFKILN